jgi:uncharacterized protein (DUF3084 family)
MKRFLLIFSLVLSLSSFAQIDYPRYEKDSLGQQVVVMTISQAMKLDNNSELLGLFEKLNSQIGSYDSVCIKVINDKERVISAQKLQISSLKEALTNKDQKIQNLQKQIVLYIDRVGILEKQIENRETVISEKNLQIRGLKTKMIFGGIGGGVAIIGLVLGLILVH